MSWGTAAFGLGLNGITYGQVFDFLSNVLGAGCNKEAYRTTQNMCIRHILLILANGKTHKETFRCILLFWNTFLHRVSSGTVTDSLFSCLLTIKMICVTVVTDKKPLYSSADIPKKWPYPSLLHSYYSIRVDFCEAESWNLVLSASTLNLIFAPWGLLCTLVL